MALRLSSKRRKKVLANRQQALIRRCALRCIAFRTTVHFIRLDDAKHLFDPTYPRNTNPFYRVSIDMT